MNLDNLKVFKRPENILLFIQVFFLLLALRVMIEAMKLPKLLQLLESERRIPVDAEKIELITKFSGFVLYRIFKSRNPCMLRSLLLFRHLNMMGMDVKVAFGVKPEAGKLRGHAWIIRESDYFLEPEDPAKEYKVVYVYP